MPGPYESIYSGKYVDKMVKRAIEGRGIKIDSIIDENSLNSVENRAIKAYIDSRFGLDRIFATVKVIYNESDTIVATSGSTVINSNTSGNYIFNIPFSGEWTFHAEIVDKTETIDVIEKGFQYTIDLTGEFPVRRSSWTYGTDQDIVDIVAALDAGTMTIEDTGWMIGDEREIQLTNSEKLTMVLMDSQHYDLTNGGKDHFVVGFKEVLLDPKKMSNEQYTMEASWSISDLRTWCNSDFRNLIPSSLRSIFKQFICKSSYSHNDDYNHITVVSTNDYFALFAEKELYGKVIWSYEEEASQLSQIQYYFPPDNIKKYIYGGPTAFGSPYWTRSISYVERPSYSPYRPGYKNPHWYVVTNGSDKPGHNNSFADSFVSPFGCI